VAFYHETFPPKERRRADASDDHGGSAAEGLDDNQILALVFSSPDGGRLRELYHDGDLTRYHGNWSVADFALVCGLARFVGRDSNRIDRIFRRSALYRDKWDEKRGDGTYGSLTISNALGRMGPGDFYRHKASDNGDSKPPADGRDGAEPGRPRQEILITTEEH